MLNVMYGRNVREEVYGRRFEMGKWGGGF